MTRLVLGILLVAALGACSTDDPARPADTGRDAKAFKQELDRLASALVPELRAAIDGELPELPASFVQKGGRMGVWHYSASGQFQQVRQDPEAAIRSARNVLEDEGFSVTSDEPLELHATSGNAFVALSAAEVPSTSEVLVDITMGSSDGLTSPDDYAQSTSPTDYAD